MDGTPATCTATVNRTWTTGDATATVDVYVGTQAGAGTATISVDRALLAAALVRQRRGTAKVYVGGERMTRLVGSVTVEESLESPVPVATFQLLDPRLATFDRATLTWGERPVQIDLTTGWDLLQTWTAFEGHTEASDNDGAYVPRGSIRAVGEAATWAEERGCVRYGAFAGKRRGGLLKALADSLGVTIANPEIESMGRIVSRPVEVNGVSLIEYAKRLGEIEGWFVRVTPEGAFELVTEYEATNGPPIYEFTPENYFAIRETAAARPVTSWVLSGSYIPADQIYPGNLQTTETISSGTDENGKPWETVTRITTDRGVEIYREVDECRTVVADGVTPGPEMLQLAKRTCVTTRWNQAVFGDGFAHYTTQLWQRITDIYELSGTPCDLGYGWEWSGGGRFVEQSAGGGAAGLLLTGKMSEEWTWYPADDALKHRRCSLKSYAATESHYYSPRVADGAGDEYPDGSWRKDSWYTFQPVILIAETWTDGRDAVPPYVQCDRSVSSFVYTVGGALAEGEHMYVSEQQVERWQDDGSGAAHWHSIESRKVAKNLLSEPWKWSTTLREKVNEPVPPPQTGSVATAQLQQTVAIDVFDASAGLPFTRVSQSEVLEGIEAPDELRNVARRRIRTAIGTVLEVRHRIVPHLRLADPVTVTDPVRSLTAQRGYVTGVRREQELLNGRGQQVTRVLVLRDEPI